VVNTVADLASPPLDIVTQSEPSIVASGERVYAANPQTGEIRIHTAAGPLTTIIRTADPLVPITDAEAEARLRRTIPTNMSSTDIAARLQRLRAAVVQDRRDRPLGLWIRYLKRSRSGSTSVSPVAH
jgi:hypothetical protein